MLNNAAGNTSPRGQGDKVSTATSVKQCRLKYAASINDEALGEDTDPDYEIEYVDIGNVDSSGKIDTVTPYRFADAPSRARRRVRDGDVIVSTVRTYLQAIASINAPPENLVVSTGFAVVRPLANLLGADYCKYALREPTFLAEVVKRSVGVSYPAINASDLGNIPIYLPDPMEQHTIAEYLDRETVRIDKLIAAKERWLEILTEKRRAVILNAVTRGLDPKAPLRDSGVPWLGQIPKHWGTKRSKWLFTERDEGSTTGEEVLLSLRMEKGLVPHNDVSNKPTSPDELIGYKKTSVGEIVINRMRASSGLIALTPQDGLVSPDYAVYCPSNTSEPLYYTYLFTTELLQRLFRSESTGLGTGSSGFLRLYSENFLAFWFPSPPLEEQKAIVAHIAKETTKIDALRTATEETIALLKERRSALISAAVTGSLKVA